jgi:hypothetical protein
MVHKIGTYMADKKHITMYIDTAVNNCIKQIQIFQYLWFGIRIRIGIKTKEGGGEGEREGEREGGGGGGLKKQNTVHSCCTFLPGEPALS